MIRASLVLLSAWAFWVALGVARDFLDYHAYRTEELVISRGAKAALVENLEELRKGDTRFVKTLLDGLFQKHRLVWVEFAPSRGKPIHRGVPVAGELFSIAHVVSNRFEIALDGKSYGTLTFAKYPETDGAAVLQHFAARFLATVTSAL